MLNEVKHLFTFRCLVASLSRNGTAPVPPGKWGGILASIYIIYKEGKRVVFENN